MPLNDVRSTHLPDKEEKESGNSSSFVNWMDFRVQTVTKLQIS